MFDKYHITENKYIESILNDGLTPQKGIRSKLIGESNTAVFYSKGFHGVIAMFFMMIERYIEYRGSEGDIHINSYNTIKKMIDDRKANGKDVGDYLNEKFTKELEIIESVNFVRNCQSYKEFLGDGICLKLNNVTEESTESHVSTFYNSWTTSIVLPQDISIVILKNQETEETLDSKYDIINYFISKVSLDEMKKLLYNNEEKETHLLWKIISNYYEENRNYLEKIYEKYDIIEIPILSYFNKENIVK